MENQLEKANETAKWTYSSRMFSIISPCHWPHAGGLKQNHVVRLKVRFMCSDSSLTSQELSSMLIYVHRDHMIRTISDGEPSNSVTRSVKSCSVRVSGFYQTRQ